MDNRDKIIEKQDELIVEYYRLCNFTSTPKAEVIEAELFELRSRLDPDIELDSDVKVYNERQDLQARTRIPVEPDKKSA